MNEVVAAILGRHSVRSYSSEPVPPEIINSIIECGNAAPTGGGARGWRFVVITDMQFRKRLAELALPRYKAWLETMPEAFRSLRAEIDRVSADPAYYGAPLIVFVVGSGMTSELDCPMVCQNMMLAARSYGIGSCWVYIGQLVLDSPEVRDKLELREGQKVFGPIVFGYPAPGTPIPPARPSPVAKHI